MSASFGRIYGPSKLTAGITPVRYSMPAVAVEPAPVLYPCDKCGGRFPLEQVTQTYTSYLYYCWPCDTKRLAAAGLATEQKCAWCGSTEPIAAFRNSRGAVSKMCDRCGKRGRYAKKE